MIIGQNNWCKKLGILQLFNVVFNLTFDKCETPEIGFN